MWVMFGEALQDFLSEHEKMFMSDQQEKTGTWKRTDYMNLYFKVSTKWLFFFKESVLQ